MAESDSEPVLASVTTPERVIAPPRTISTRARIALSVSAQTPRIAWPDPNDHDAWRNHVRQHERMWQTIAVPMLSQVESAVSTTRIADVVCHVAVPPGHEQEDRVYLFMHGGAFVLGSGPFAKALGATKADRLHITTVSVDYRVPPDHPFPAAVEDCLAVYQALIERYGPERVVVGGASAGGNLATAMILMARDRGLPMPAGAVLLTPEIDLTESGDTFRTNRDLDLILKDGVSSCNALYAAGHDLTDPYLSPIFADYSKGFPPAMIQSGTRDMFLSNSVLLHRKLREAGIEAELHVWEAMPHGGFGFGDAPENLEIDQEVKRFVDRICPARG